MVTFSPGEIMAVKSLSVNLGPKHRVTHGRMSPWRDETVFLLNVSPQEAHVEVVVYYSVHDPVGPYHLTVPARRMKTPSWAERSNQNDGEPPIF